MHPEADALLDAIYDRPNDDTARLVYADWLQEHGHEDYAQFIRLSVQIARGTFSPAEHKQLRKERHQLGQQVEQAHPMARHVTLSKARPLDGVPRRFFSTDAKGFLETWPAWWPFLRPRILQLRDTSGYERDVARCPYLSRIESLVCEGVVLSGCSTWRDELQWRPVSAGLLQELSVNPDLSRLTALKVEPISAIPEELLAFAETPFASRLEELDLWIEVAPHRYESIRVVTGTVRHEIQQFVGEHWPTSP